RTGDGLATEGVQAVISAARELPQVAHLEIHCGARNKRSAALPARLGFRLAPRDSRGTQSSADASELQVWTLALGNESDRASSSS
ncbi:MAG: GNAT family N-acetyltransferase, partial [Gemmatimonadaceae bacterium]|nr:GNAT family N-acetyltransferase [Gemmatimonadaceae bacterium]